MMGTLSLIKSLDEPVRQVCPGPRATVSHNPPAGMTRPDEYTASATLMMLIRR